MIIASCNVHLDDNNVVEVIGMKFIIVEAIVTGKINRIHIKYTLHVPKLYVNVLSVTKLVSNKLKVQFNLNECIVKIYNSKVIARQGNLYEINFVKVYKADAANLVQFPTGDGALKFWHHHLSHLTVKNIHMLQNMMNDMNLSKLSFSIFLLL